MNYYASLARRLEGALGAFEVVVVIQDAMKGAYLRAAGWGNGAD